MTKKLISLILLFCMAVSVFAGCSAKQPYGTDSSFAASGEQSEIVSEAPYDVNAYLEEIDSLYRYDIKRDGMERYLVSTGKTVAASRGFEGDASVLTDGAFVTVESAKDTEDALFFEGRNDTELVLDLGDITCVSDFGLSILSSVKLDTSLPREVVYYVSTDGESYTLIGTAYRTRSVPENQSALYDLRLQKGIDARYIKALIPSDSFVTDKLYVDEFCVFDYREAEDENVKQEESYYQNEPMPEVTENIYWQSSESDYNTQSNLVSKLPYRITAGGWIESDLQTDYYNTPVSNPALTDGITATSASYTDSRYFHFTRFLSRTVIFDLEKVSGITGIEIGFLRDEGPGIRLPANVSVLGSYDGKNWGMIAEGNPRADDPGSPSTAHRFAFTLDFDKSKARFVAVKISVDSHVWLDEMKVLGTKNAENAAEPNFENNGEAAELGYISPDALGGSENLLLTYTFRNENPEAGLNTAEELLPYVAYLDKEGNIQDTFFDSFLFLPCSTVCPSGGRLYYYEEAPARMTDWLAFEEDLFYEDCNVNGLEIAAEQLNAALGTNTKIPIYFSVFSTVYGDKNFGDVDGDGVNEDFSNVEDRKKVVKWWIDRLIARYESGEYQNLKLDGFYWYHEELESADPDERELILYTAEYLHSLGYYFIWIPYYLAGGFSEWQSLGFDAAVMQPNYMFSDDAPIDRLYNNAEYTKAFGMGVEIEADFGVISDTNKLEKYRAYLRAGVETGYMHSIKMYYQDAGPGVFYGSYNSTNAAFRSVYEDTYKFAKGILTLDPPELAETEFTRLSGGAVNVQLATKDGSTADVTLQLAPKYGSVKYMGDGKFVYYPPEGFVGTDTFTVITANGKYTKEVVITLYIK